MSEGDISIDGLPPMPHKLESMEGPGQTNVSALQLSRGGANPIGQLA